MCCGARICHHCFFLSIRSVWLTLNQFGKTAGVQLDMTAVLHTWGQNLSLHPHLHCIVLGGGMDAKGTWQTQLRSRKGAQQSVQGKICTAVKTARY